MPLGCRIRSLWRNVVRRHDVDRELAEELRAYVDELTDRKRRGGLDAGSARRQALAEIGGISRVQDQVRRERIGWWLESWVLDIGYAVRRVKAAPGFAAAAILTIALGVGLNAGAFSIVNSVLFGGLPVPAADELVDLYETVDGLAGRNEKGRVNRRFTTTEYRTLRDRTETLSGLIGYSVDWTVWLRGETPRQITGRYVTCSYFEVLRQPPALGRPLSAEDCAPGAPPVVVLGHDLWRAAFAADPAIVGRTLTLNLAQVTVVGVATVDAYQPDLQRLDYFAPITIQPLLRPDRQWLASEEFGWLTLIGRRAAGRSVEEVRSELNVIAAQLDRQFPGRSTSIFVDLATTPTNQPVYGGRLVAGAIIVLAPFGLILLIACANVANLFLARTTERTHEIATRLSLGASRGRVVQQLLAESLLVSLAGGMLGLLVAFWSFDGLSARLLAPLSVVLPRPELDIRLLSFALLLSAGTGVLTGLAPALRASNTQLQAAMNRSSSGRRHTGGRLQGAFIGVQVAICMALLITTGLLLRGLYDANVSDPGFPARDVVVVSADLRDFGYVGDDLIGFQRRLADRVRALPGVEAVGYTPSAPWDRRSSYDSITLRDPEDGQLRRFSVGHVEPDYLTVLGVSIVRGRAFTEADFTGIPTAVILNETTARHLWPDRDPLGQTLVARTRVGPDLEQERTWHVVGVARDAQTAFAQSDPWFLYLPSRLAPEYRHMHSLMVRSRRPFASLSRDIHAVLEGLDPKVVMGVAPLQANLGWYRYVSALISGLAVSLGVLALALASVGIYGVVGHVVAGRRREIGIRLALGATARSVLAVILGRTLRPVATGAAIGGVGGVALSGLMASAVFGLSPMDPIGAGGAALLVLGVALLASVLPARRGLRADPLRALQSE